MEATLRDETLVRSQAVVARVVAGETLIVPVRAKVGDLASIYSFNGTGSLIWKLLESPRTVAELAAAVARAYEVELARAEQDVTNFVSEMKISWSGRGSGIGGDGGGLKDQWGGKDWQQRARQNRVRCFQTCCRRLEGDLEQLSYGAFSADLHRRQAGERVPLQVSIEVTRRCPLECLHCYNNLPMGDMEAKRRELTKEEHFRCSTNWSRWAASGCSTPAAKSSPAKTSSRFTPTPRKKDS